jgi:TPP-dependent pyruvate/acetoin dehydrogenase alpha subunit
MVDYDNLYKSLYRIRRTEEEIARVYPSDKIKSPVHLSIGQEAVSVGVCEALEPSDKVFGTYRGHAVYLAKGGDMNRMIAELYGKETGCAKGKGGSMHLIDVEHGVMGMSAVVATTIPQAVGYAYALKSQGSKSIVVSFFGDGAVDEGVFYESLNFAQLKSLPILFICENNLYAIQTHQDRRQAPGGIVARVEGYGIPALRVEDNDVLEINKQTARAVAKIRSGRSGPQFLECMTYRWKEHVGPNDDFAFGFRDRTEAEHWKSNDQVRIIGEALEPTSKDAIQRSVDEELKLAFEFAEASAFPAPEQLYHDVF